MNTTAILTFVLGLTLGILAALLFRGRNTPSPATPHSGEDQQSAADRANLQRDLAQLSGQVQALRGGIEQLSGRTGQQLGALSSQLQTAALSDARLLSATRDLQAALSRSSTRGAWGELELQRLVEAAGMMQHVHFDTQRTIDGRSRPDMTVQLPQGGTIPLDAKVPLDAFIRATEASRAGEDDRQHLAEHARALRGHIDALDRRSYHTQMPGSLGFTLLFLPLEPLLSAALDASPDLVEYAARKQIYLVTPASLLATLRASASIWVLARTDEDAQAVVQLGSELANRLATMTGHLEKIGNALQSALRSYNATIGSLETRILPQISRIQAVKTIDAPKRASDVTIRPILNPHLTDPTSQEPSAI